MTLDDTVVLKGALTQVHGSMDCIRTADIDVFESMMVDRAKEIYTGAMPLNATAAQAAYAVLGAYEASCPCFREMVKAYWHAHARPEPVEEWEEEEDGLCEVLGCGRECSSAIPLVDGEHTRICPTCLWYRLRKHAPYICSECDGPLVHETSECLICKGERPESVEEWVEVDASQVVLNATLKCTHIEESRSGVREVQLRTLHWRGSTRVTRHLRIRPPKDHKLYVEERTGGDAA